MRHPSGNVLWAAGCWPWGSEGRSELAGCDLGSLEPGPLEVKAAIQGWACSARSYRCTCVVTCLESSFPHSLRAVRRRGSLIDRDFIAH